MNGDKHAQKDRKEGKYKENGEWTLKICETNGNILYLNGVLACF